MSTKQDRTPWILWPFVVLGRLIATIIRLTGRLVAAVIGLAVMIAGLALTVTIIGAIVGIPLIIFGFMLMVRAVF